MLDYVQQVVGLVKESPGLASLATGAVTSVIGYLVGRKRRRKEYEKLQTEVDNLRGSQLQKLHEYDESFREADRHLVEACKLFYQAHNAESKDKQQFDKSRDDLCAALSDVLARQVATFEFRCHVDRIAPSKLQTLIDATVSDLRLWRKCLLTINHQPVIEYLGRRPLIIRRHTLQPIRDACKGLKLNPDAVEALNRAIDEIVSVGVDQDYPPPHYK
jgi:hypothetical protein